MILEQDIIYYALKPSKTDDAIIENDHFQMALRPICFELLQVEVSYLVK